MTSPTTYRCSCNRLELPYFEQTSRCHLLNKKYRLSNWILNKKFRSKLPTEVILYNLFHLVVNLKVKLWLRKVSAYAMTSYSFLVPLPAQEIHYRGSFQNPPEVGENLFAWPIPIVSGVSFTKKKPTGEKLSWVEKTHRSKLWNRKEFPDSLMQLRAFLKLATTLVYLLFNELMQHLSHVRQWWWRRRQTNGILFG